MPQDPPPGSEPPAPGPARASEGAILVPIAMLLASVGLFAFGLASLYQGGNLAVSLDRPSPAETAHADERLAERRAAQDYIVSSQRARLSEAAAAVAPPDPIDRFLPSSTAPRALPDVEPAGVETPLVVPPATGVVPALPRVPPPPAAEPAPDPVAAAPPAASRPAATPAPPEPAPAKPAEPEPQSPPTAAPSEPAPSEGPLDPVLDALLGPENPSDGQPQGGIITEILGGLTP